MRNINHIIQSIKDYKGFKQNAELADFLGVARSTISMWIARKIIDEELIREKIPEIRKEFLKTGQFPMTEQNDIINILLQRIAVMERKIEQLEKELKQYGTV